MRAVHSGWFVGLILALFASLGYATPFSLIGSSGYRGDSVAATLVDGSTINFTAATIEVRFDENVLDFVSVGLGGALLGDLDGDGTDDFGLLVDDSNAGAGVVLASVVTTRIDPLNAILDAALLQTNFAIRAAAAYGDTSVSFQCWDYNPSNPPLYCSSDYVIPTTAGAITVLERHAVPSPGTFGLLILGMLLLGVVRGHKSTAESLAVSLRND